MPARYRVPTHFHTMRFSAGTYLALPSWTLQSTLVVLRGVGILRTTLLALSFGLKLALIWIVYSTRDLPISSTIGWTRKGSWTLLVDRYLCEPTACQAVPQSGELLVRCQRTA